jgi:hypothetical protein
VRNFARMLVTSDVAPEPPVAALRDVAWAITETLHYDFSYIEHQVATRFIDRLDGLLRHDDGEAIGTRWRAARAQIRAAPPR